MHLPIIAQLIQSGYIKDDAKWLTSKAFVSIGEKILRDFMRSLKKDGFGLHETNIWEMARLFWIQLRDTKLVTISNY